MQEWDSVLTRMTLRMQGTNKREEQNCPLLNTRCRSAKCVRVSFGLCSLDLGYQRRISLYRILLQSPLARDINKGEGGILLVAPILSECKLRPRRYRRRCQVPILMASVFRRRVSFLPLIHPSPLPAAWDWRRKGGRCCSFVFRKTGEQARWLAMTDTYLNAKQTDYYRDKCSCWRWGKERFFEEQFVKLQCLLARRVAITVCVCVCICLINFWTLERNERCNCKITDTATFNHFFVVMECKAINMINWTTEILIRQPKVVLGTIWENYIYSQKLSLLVFTLDSDTKTGRNSYLSVVVST